MGKEYRRYDYDPVAALRNAPSLLGMELRQCGQNKLCGGYYLNGDIHPWRRDKIKVFISRGSVWVAEEGGQCISLPNWLIQYGHCADFGEAIRAIKGQSQALDWSEHKVRQKETEIKYVSKEVLEAAKRYDLRTCPLFRWFCTLFPEDRVREAFERSNVTTDSKGLAVFWAVNQEGKILHDKRIKYMENGHRDKSFGGTREFKTAYGYSGRCFFGSHLIPESGNEDILVVEAEKTAIALYLITGKVVLATAGKNNLREKDERFLCYPDLDSVEEWTATGNRIKEWWTPIGDKIPLGPTDDVCDLIEKAPRYGVIILRYWQEKWWTASGTAQ